MAGLSRGSSFPVGGSQDGPMFPSSSGSAMTAPSNSGVYSTTNTPSGDWHAMDRQARHYLRRGGWALYRRSLQGSVVPSHTPSASVVDPGCWTPGTPPTSWTASGCGHPMVSYQTRSDIILAIRSLVGGHGSTTGRTVPVFGFRCSVVVHFALSRIRGFPAPPARSSPVAR